MKERAFQHNNLIVRYKTRRAKKDIRHLVVMFSGIRPHRDYEFDGQASASSQSDWLWIRDDFDGEQTYYLCQDFKFDIEHAVIKLIESHLELLGLDKSSCTLVGFSKGGSAALYFGVKYGFTNIVASVPQIAIGTYVKETRPGIMKHMTSDQSATEFDFLDNLIPNAVANDENLNKNIFIWSALGDREYETQVGPFLPMFSKYKNFNSIITDSPLVTTHNEVTKYNLSTILGVIYLISEGAVPSFGQIRNGSELSSPAGPRQKAVHGDENSALPVVNFDEFILTGSLVFPRGVGFIRGHEVSGYGQVARNLTLTNEFESHSFPLAATVNKWVNSKFYNGEFRDYRFSGFASPKHKGIQLHDISAGIYRVGLEVLSREKSTVSIYSSNRDMRTISHSNEHIYLFDGGKSEGTLFKLPVIGFNPAIFSFDINDFWIRDSRFHVDGTFAVRGLEMRTWLEVDYFIVFILDESFITMKLGSSINKNINIDFEDDNNKYSGAVFASPKYEGLDISRLVDGEYEVHVSMLHGSSVFSKRIGRLKLKSDERVLLVD